MSSDAVFVIVSVLIVFIFTAWNIRFVLRRDRLYRELRELLKDAETARAEVEPHAPDEGATQEV